MTTALRLLKADPRNSAAHRIRLANLAEAVGPQFDSAPFDSAEFDSAAFEPLALPTQISPHCEPPADSRLDSALATLQVAAAQLHAQHDHWLDQSQQEAVRLGVAIAERLLRRTLAVQPAAILDLIRSALDWSVSADRLRVRLHPGDAELVASAAQPLDANREIEFFPDDSLTRGDCVVETPNGQTDARLEVILQRIADELLAE